MNYAAMRYVVEEGRLTGAAHSILLAIAYRADRQTGECYLSKRRLAVEAGVSLTTVKRVISHLVEGGHLAVIIDGSGRRSTCYQVIHRSTTDPLDPPVEGPPRPPSGIVVGPSENGSGSIGAPVVGPWWALYIRKEGKNEGKNGRAEPAAPPSPAPSPSGAATDSASEEQGPDPRELMAKAVLSFDPGAVQDDEGWNLSDRFSRAWLPNEDVAKWLRHVRKVTA